MRDDQMDGGVGPQKADEPLGRRGFPALRCLACRDDSVYIHLLDVTVFRCDEEDCEAEWTADEVREALGEWAAVLSWVAQAPPLP